MSDFIFKFYEKGIFGDSIQALREDVFVIEQNGAHFNEFDEIDNIAWHLEVFSDGKTAACGRIADLGNNSMKIGRIAVAKKYRGSGLGFRLVSALCEKAKQLGAEEIIVDSQVGAVEFYKKLGFSVVGKEHTDGSVLHIEMKK